MKLCARSHPMALSVRAALRFPRPRPPPACPSRAPDPRWIEPACGYCPRRSSAAQTCGRFLDCRWRLLQVAQRGIAGPKVVQGDAHPQFLQFLELPGGFPDIVHDHALGDFQVQVRRLRRVSASVAATVSARPLRANCTAEVLTAPCMGP